MLASSSHRVIEKEEIQQTWTDAMAMNLVMRDKIRVTGVLVSVASGIVW